MMQGNDSIVSSRPDNEVREGLKDIKEAAQLTERLLFYFYIAPLMRYQ